MPAPVRKTSRVDHRLLDCRIRGARHCGNRGDPLSPIPSATTNLDTLTTARSFSLATLDIANKKIVFASDPKLTAGQAVVYNKGSGNPSIGLTDGQIYYVANPTANAIQLADELGNIIAFTGSGPDTCVDTLTPAASFDPSSVHVQNNEVTFAGNHNMIDGQRVIYRTGNGNTPIGGLTNGQPYYVEYVNATTIRLKGMTTIGGVNGAADNGSGLIRIEIASTANLATGDQVSITGVTGTTESNGTWMITVIDSTHFDLQGSTFEQAYSGGGTVFTKTIIHLDTSSTEGTC